MYLIFVCPQTDTSTGACQCKKPLIRGNLLFIHIMVNTAVEPIIDKYSWLRDYKLRNSIGKLLDGCAAPFTSWSLLVAEEIASKSDMNFSISG